MNRIVFLSVAATVALTTLVVTNRGAEAAGCERGCAEVLEARTYHVEADCLSTDQLDRLDAGFASRLGSVAFLSEDVDASCIVDSPATRSGAPEGAGVSPFTPCGLGSGRADVPECVFAALISEGPGGEDQVAIINPDSMHPGCLVGSVPTPHP
jgi:hypothetical protein